MSFLDAVTQGLGGLIVGLAMMLLITGLVARTSRRVLGIQVSITRALLVSLILSVVLGSLPTLASFPFDPENPSAADLATISVIGVAVLLGVFVMGGVAASYVKLGTGLEFITQDGVNIHVQQMLDGIFPQLLPLVVVLGTWYLMAKRGVSPVKAMVLLLVLAALGVASGLFAG